MPSHSNNVYTIDGHTLEFSSGSSSIDPWSSEHCRKIGLAVMCTSDIVPYVLVDGEYVHRIRSSNKAHDLRTALIEGAIDSWDELLYFYSDVVETEYSTLSHSKNVYDKMKKREDEFHALSKEEQEKVKEAWRKKRDAQREKLKVCQKCEFFEKYDWSCHIPIDEGNKCPLPDDKKNISLKHEPLI